MKLSRIAALGLSLLMLLSLVACTGDVPPPYESDKILAEATIPTKVVVQQESEVEGEEPTLITLLEKDIYVTSTSMPKLSLKNLVDTLFEENHISGQRSYNAITVMQGYENTDTHMWVWTIDGNQDLPFGSTLQQGNSVVFTYAKRGVELATDDEGNVLTLSVPLSIRTDTETFYDQTVVIEGQDSMSVKDLLKHLRENGDITVSVAGSIKAINDVSSTDTMRWQVFVNDESVKPSASVSSNDVVRIVFAPVTAD